MNSVFQHYIIDLSSNNNFVQIPTMQGDGNNIRGFEVELIQNGTQYVIDKDDCVIAIMGTKPDTHHIVNECHITDEGYIQIDITSQMSAVKGRGDYQIVLMSKRTNSQLKSFPFYIITTPATFDIEHIISSDEFQLLTHNILKTDTVIDIANKAISDIRTLETNVEEQELIRIANEISRENAELSRDEAEKKRDSEESARNTAENNRRENETIRINSENQRLDNEASRITAEETRSSKENERQNNETIRIDNEKKRQDAESNRAATELIRCTAEEERNAAEAERNSNENNRETAENTRNENEDERLQNEIARETAEIERAETFEALTNDIDSELAKLETANIEALEESNSFKVKVTNREGQSSTSPNLLNTIQIGIVETGDSEENPTASITGDFGNQKLNLRLPSGKPFKISGTYSSIAAMNDDSDNINLYDFIMIHTGSVEDEDTGKLFMKDASGMVFITDLSGVQGIQGVKGDTGLTPNLTVGTVVTGAPGTQASVTITGTPENPIINLSIPKGDTGSITNISGANIPYANEEDTNNIKDVVDGKLGKTETAAFAAKLSSERTIDGIKFNGESNVIHYATCSTAAATVAKTISLTGFVLSVGATVKVKFTVTNTATNPTLNVNSTGAVPIYYCGSAISPGYLEANRIYEFVYNGAQYELVGDLNTDTKNTTGSTNNNSKLFIIGATVQSSNTQTYSRNSTYIGSDGCLYSNNNRLNTELVQSTEPSTQKVGDFWVQEYT
ncbi:hypothetical protein NSB25_24360 [Acetatifactor muris]|uniref:BppU N-terminal domain-containing protein n=1 Tax=Acetatifactor muris TaxID=879566 RepID=A0A2K4ZNI6_9FIRM|nr:hypothetical protein [Acetatifactor muris]MCR2050380.1 hypothetical protein [Acetatifactor muris]SOY32047.1 hypothetical protein AMURIS_04800 [Acetatifactor muris]